MILIGATFIVAIVLAYWQRLHHDLERMKFVNQVKDLRFQLQLLVFRGELDKESFGFKFFDSLMSTAIRDANLLTLFRFTVLGLRNQNPLAANNRFAVDYHSSLDSNPMLNEIAEGLYESLTNYIIGQHFLTFKLITIPWSRKAREIRIRLREFAKRSLIADESRSFSDVSSTA